MTVRRALFLSTLDRYFTLIANFLLAAAVSRILMPTEIGVSVVGMAILGVALSVREFASSNFLIQQQTLTREDVCASFSVMFAFTTVLVTILVPISPTLAHIYGEPKLTAYFRVIAICLFTDLVSIQVIALLRRELAYGHIAIIDIVGTATGAVATIILALTGFSYMSFAWAWLAASVAMLVTSVMIRRQLWIFRLSFRNWHGMLRFGGYNGAIALLYKIYETSPYLLFGSLISPHAAAIFSRSLMICQIPDKTILGGALSVILPAFSEGARKGQRLDRPYLHSLEIITALHWPALLCLSLLASPIVELVLGRQWSEVVPLVRIIAIASLFSFSFSLNYPLMIAMGALKATFIRALISLPLSTVIMIVAVVEGGLYWAAWSMMFVIPFQAIVVYTFLHRQLAMGHLDFVRALWRSGVTALLTAAGPLCVAAVNGFDWHLSIAQAAVASVLAAALWMTGLLVTKHPVLKEILAFKSALQRALSSNLKLAASAGK